MYINNKRKRYSLWTRLLDTRYSTQGEGWRYVCLWLPPPSAY